MKRLRTILQYRYTFKYLTLVIVSIVSIFVILFPKNTKYTGSETNIVGVIKQINIDGNKLTMLIKDKEDIIVNYYFDNEKEKIKFVSELELGDTIKI